MKLKRRMSTWDQLTVDASTGCPLNVTRKLCRLRIAVSLQHSCHPIQQFRCPRPFAKRKIFLPKVGNKGDGLTQKWTLPITRLLARLMSAQPRFARG